MDIEEIHVDRNLDALALQELRLKNCLIDDYTPVRHGSDDMPGTRFLPHRHPEEHRLPNEDHQHYGRQRPEDPRTVEDKVEQDYGDGAKDVGQCHGSV